MTARGDCTTPATMADRIAQTVAKADAATLAVAGIDFIGVRTV